MVRFQMFQAYLLPPLQGGWRGSSGCWSDVEEENMSVI